MKKTINKDFLLEDFLATPASPPLVRRLVWAGLIPPKKFIRALNLAGNNSFFKKYGLLILAIAASLYILCALATYLSFAWKDISYIAKIAGLSTLLTLLVSIAVIKGISSRLGVLLLGISSLLTGVLLFLSSNNYELGKPLWGFAVLWLILITPWTVLAKSLSLWFVWLGIAIFTGFMWGLEAALPSSLCAWTDFFSLFAVAVGVTLAVREWLLHFKKQAWLAAPLARLAPLFASLSLALTPVLGYAADISGASLTDSGLIFLLLVVLSFVFYAKIFPDFRALVIIVFESCAALTALIIKQYLSAHDNWYLVFIGLIVLFSFSSILLGKLKSYCQRGGLKNA